MTPETVSEPIRILVVDDHAGMRLTLKGILTRKGYAVSVAEDGPQAIEAVRKTKFRLVLMDIKMPGMSGVEAFLQIKAISPQTSVIMMTAYALEDEIRRAIREGAYTVVYKPFEIEKMLAVISECLDGRSLILAVDDDVETRELLTAIFENKGFNVVTANSGEECIKIILEKRFQILLLDIVLPGMDGVETLKAVKKVRPDLGVIMITGNSVEKLIEQALLCGSYACLHKPLDTARIFELVDRHLRGETAVEGPQ